MTCDCEMQADEPARWIDCHDCGGACCPSCQIDVDAHTYCPRCAAAFVTA